MIIGRRSWRVDAAMGSPMERDALHSQVSSIGNRLGLVIEKPILELLDIDHETELEMTTDGDRLIIEPVRSARQAKLRAAARRAMDAHDSTFRKLAK